MTMTSKIDRQCFRRGTAGLLAAVLVLACSPQWTRAQALGTYITGESGSDRVIFRALFDTTVPNSGVVSIAAYETNTTGRLDNIDFTPGTGFAQVHVSQQRAGGGAITSYNVLTGAELPDYVPETSLGSFPPASGVSRPASVLPTATHIYYVENQFGFAGGAHRIMRTPLAGPAGTTEVVFDGSSYPGGLTNFSGLEIVGARMYTFVRDPTDPADTRALVSFGLSGAGIWDGMIPGPTGIVKNMTGLFEALGPGVGPFASDGSDELTFDPVTGYLFGTNIANGEVIAYDPVGGMAITSPGAAAGRFIDAGQIDAGAATGLNLLDEMHRADGIRSTGTGHLVWVGHGGVLAAIDIAGVLADGADDGDIIPLFFNPAFEFDDHASLAPASAVDVAAVPEPSTLVIVGAGLLLLARLARRRPSSSAR